MTEVPSWIHAIADAVIPNLNNMVQTLRCIPCSLWSDVILNANVGIQFACFLSIPLAVAFVKSIVFRLYDISCAVMFVWTFCTSSPLIFFLVGDSTFPGINNFKSFVIISHTSLPSLHISLSTHWNTHAFLVFYFPRVLLVSHSTPASYPSPQHTYKDINFKNHFIPF